MRKGLKEISPINSNNSMNKEDLEKLTKNELIELLLKPNESKKSEVAIIDDTKPTRLNRTPIPEGVEPFKPAQKVKLRRKQKVVADRPGMVLNPATNRWIKIGGPTYFKRQKVKPWTIRNPATNRSILIGGQTYKKVFPMQYALNRANSLHREINKTSKSIDYKYKKVSDGFMSSPKITQIQKALKNSTKSFAVDIVDNKDQLHQLTETKKVIENYLNKELGELKGFKYIETLKMTFEKQLENKTTIKTAYFNSKTKTLINENEINEVLQTSRQELMKAIGQWISEGSGWTILSVDGHYINLTKYKPLQGSSYIELPTELRNPAKGLINLQNKDDCCFAWCHVRYLNPKDKNPQRITKSDNKYIQEKIVNYDEIQFPVTTKQYNKIEKQNDIRINVFGYENKQFFPIYISSERYEKHMELLLITEGEKNHYVLIKDFNKLMYQQTRHKDRKIFACTAYNALVLKGF